MSESIPNGFVEVKRSDTAESTQVFYDALDGSADGSGQGTKKPPPGSLLSGKQEHYLKRELIAQQAHDEIVELNSPTALQRFGAPFRSDVGEVAPADSELPILRYMFVHFVRNFPFLDQAREKEFWQDKLQIFLESFAKKHISSSEDRLEESKRRKLALKAEKITELMMVSGIPTASGYEERIRFAEMEVVDRGANEQGLVANMPEGREINGWDINVASVRTTAVKRTMRYHQHAEFVIRVKERGRGEYYVGRRYGQFSKMLKQLKTEMPGKALPPLPRKNKTHTGALLSAGGDDSDSDSVSSVSTQGPLKESSEVNGGFRAYIGLSGHKRDVSTSSGANSPRPLPSPKPPESPRPPLSSEMSREFTLYREEQRVSLRAFLRMLLQNERVAQSNAMREFLSVDPFVPNREEMNDVARRKEMDERRIEEGKKFYEIARKRARELDVHMEKFRREIVESDGLTSLFREIKVKNTIAELSPEYKKFAEWLRIEVAATIYHLFLAEDNAAELFAQLKRVHSLIPYVALKNVIRFTNPAAVMKGVLDLFLAQPLGARSLMQRIIAMSLNDGIKNTDRSLEILTRKINDWTLSAKIKAYTEADEDVKNILREEALSEQVDLVVVLLRTELIEPELDAEHVGRIFNAYVAWHNAVENVDDEMKAGAELFAHLKQLLKQQTRHRDKQQMLSMIEESVTLQLFRDLFTIFYEPLIRVYKSANVYSSITDFASFVEDIIKTVDAAQTQNISSDPNQTVQAFIDLCARHEDDFYRFVHEVHIHDNGLFDQLMGWMEGILNFLRHGPNGGKLDMNALVQGAVESRQVDKDKLIEEVNTLVDWQMARKRWHNAKTRRKMAVEQESTTGIGFSSSDFGIDAEDIQDLGLGEDDADDDDDDEERDDERETTEPIAVERERRKRIQDALKSRAGEPEKPQISEVRKLREGFVSLLRMVLAE